jgi:aminopeptidase N
MEAASGQDLKAFFNQYLLRADNLQLKGSWNYDAANQKIVLKLQQTQSSKIPFDFPIEIAVYKTNVLTPEIMKLNMNDLTAEFSIPASSKPELLIVDPRAVLLHEFEWR